MSRWPYVKFSDLAANEKSSFSMGPFGSKITKENYIPHGVPVIRGNNLSRGIFTDSEFVFISDRKADEIISANIAPGDLIFTHRGTIGQVTMLPRKPNYSRYVIGSSQVKTRINQEIALPEFYYYWFQSPMGQHSILVNASTVGVPGIATPLTSIRNLQVPIPPLREQRGVASALGALDDKIAVNARVSAEALKIADLSHTQFTSQMEIRKETTFGEVAGIGGGGTPRTSEDSYWNGEIPWATPTDVTSLSTPYLFRTNKTITDSGLENCASRLYPENSIFMTSRATIGAFALPEHPSAVNQGFIVVIPPNDAMRWWLFHEMLHRVDEMKSLANGSTFLELSRKNFKMIKLNIPEESHLREFASKAKQLHSCARNAAAESRTLAQLRDTLLPPLMSGKLRVRDAERIVEDAV